MEPLLKMPEAKKKFFADKKLFSSWEKNFETLLTAKGKIKDTALNDEIKMLRTELMCMLWIAYYKEMESNQSE